MVNEQIVLSDVNRNIVPYLVALAEMERRVIALRLELNQVVAQAQLARIAGVTNVGVTGTIPATVGAPLGATIPTAFATGVQAPIVGAPGSILGFHVPAQVGAFNAFTPGIAGIAPGIVGVPHFQAIPQVANPLVQGINPLAAYANLGLVW
jgi:hypothetical protein